MDLVLRFCRDADPQQQHLDTSSYYTIAAFDSPQSRDVLQRMLAPMRTDDPLADGTLAAVGPSGVEESFRPVSRITVNGLFVATRSRFEDAPEQPAIEGNRVPQVPTFQVGGSVIYSDPIGFTGSVQMRAFGSQFDDDLNELKLDEYGVVDLSASQQVLRGLNVFVAVENLFDKDYDTGRTPLRTVGWPRTARVGVRLFLP